MKTSRSQNLFKTSIFLVLSLWTAAALEGLWAYDLNEDKDEKDVSSKKPVLINAYQLSFDRPDGITLFSGDVNAHHDGTILLADQIRALEENREATAEGHVKVIDTDKGVTLSCGNLEYQDLMSTMTAHDHPLLTMPDEKGRPLTVIGRQMEVDNAHKTVVVNQNVQILHKEGKAESQKATFLSRQDKFILEGSPKITTDNGLLTGRRIVSNLTGDRGVIVEGMADAVFNPNGKPDLNPTLSLTPNPTLGKGGGAGAPGDKIGQGANGTGAAQNTLGLSGLGADNNPAPTPTAYFHWQ